MPLPGIITTPIDELVRDLPEGRKPSGKHCRSELCPACSAETWQVLHGYTLSGKLWKGHVCACRDWQCSRCGELVNPIGKCCR